MLGANLGLLLYGEVSVMCSQTLLMLQEENIVPAETFTANSGDVESTRYMGHQ